MSYAYDPPEPIADARAQWDEAMGRLEKSVRTFAELAEPKSTATVKAERDRYEAALVKITNWKGYQTNPDWPELGAPFTDYEQGANDMLEMLQQIAKAARD